MNLYLKNVNIWIRIRDFLFYNVTILFDKSKIHLFWILEI